MLVTVSKRASKTSRVYHKPGCVYGKKIKMHNLSRLTVIQAKDKGFCECKYCAGLKGDVNP